MGKKRFKFEGLDEYLEKLQELTDEFTVQGYLGEAVYEGAAIVADAVKKEIEAIPVRSPKVHGTKENPVSGLIAAQKQGLKNSFGLSKMRDEGGFVNTKIGFDGYNNIKTKNHPSGQPNSMIARSLESGTSWLRKDPFITRATRSAKAEAEDRIGKVLDEKIKEIMGD